MKREILWFKVVHGKRLRTSPLLGQHALLELTPSVESAQQSVQCAVSMQDAPCGSPAPNEVEPGDTKQQDTECAAGGLGFYPDNLAPTDDDTATSEQLLLQYAEIFGTDQQQATVEELTDNTTAVETAANATAAKEPCDASALGKGIVARRTGISYMAKRPSVQRCNKSTLPAGSGAAQASATPVKERLDLQELLKNAFKPKVSSMIAMIEEQNAYLLRQDARDPSTAIFTQSAMETQLSTHNDPDELFMVCISESGEWS
jgi:hypothetical protein